MAELVAVQSGLALFRAGDLGVIIDTTTLNPCDPQPIETILASGGWNVPLTADAPTPPAAYEIADAALEPDSIIPVVIRGSSGSGTSATRVVRVPKKVQDAVRRAYASEGARGLSDDILELANQAASGSVSVEDARRIAEYVKNPRSATYTVFGRQDAVEWVNKVCGSSLTAAVPDPADPTIETDWTDPTKPHEFVVLADGETDCAICSKPESDPLHVASAETAAADAPDEAESGTVEYFATFAPGGDQGTTFKVDAIYAKDADGSWWIREMGEWSPTQALDGTQDVVELDLESFNAAAKQLDEPGTEYAELSITEDRLFELAEPYIDYPHLDAVFAAAPYIPPAVRSANAKKQLRDGQGHFIVQGGVVKDSSGQRGTIARVDHDNGTVEVKGEDGQTKSVPANEVAVDRNAGASDPAGAHGPAKATLPSPLPLVPDVKALIAQYQERWAEEKGQAVTAAGDDNLIPPPEDAPASASPTASGPSTPAVEPTSEPADDGDPVASAGVTPLYLAEVDANDTAAVLETLAVIPSTGDGDPIDVYKRNNGKWERDDAIRSQLQGPTPPPVVELGADMLQNVLSQMDSNPTEDAAPQPVAAAGFARLQKFAISETGLTASQVQGARLLMPYGQKLPQDIISRLDELAAGVDTHPAAAERLRIYWTVGEGGRAKIRWGEPGDGSRCIKHLRKYMGPRAAGYCQLRHHEMTGRYMGHGPGEEKPHAMAAALVGEVQTDPQVEEDFGSNDPDLPHEYLDAGDTDLVDGGNCAICDRGMDHPVHVVVLAAPTSEDELPDEHDALVTEPHEITPGPDGLCECGKPADDPIHTLTGDPVPESQDDYAEFDDEVDFSTLHEFVLTTDNGDGDENRCDCGRPRADAMHRSTGILADATQEISPGQRFRIPLVVPEGVSSGDGRTFAPNSLTSRPMPLALMWQPEGDEGHKGSVIVGRVDHVERTEAGLGNAYGVFDTGIWGQEALRLVQNGMLRGISADLDEFEAYALNEDEDGDGEEADGGDEETGNGEVVELRPAKPEKISAQKMLVNKGRLMGVTLVAKPAYAECTIELVDGDESMDGPWRQQPSEEARVAALVAAGVPLHPPAEWFQNPKLDKPTHLSVTDDGRVFGHIAAWDVDHIGLPMGTRAPRSVSNYAYFRTGALQTAEGQTVRVGQLTLTGGHAPLSASAKDAVKHYDDTASAVADLAAGEDRYGIWVSGALRPGVTAEQIRALRASSPSGDWRPIKGSLELVAVCQVNVPGFPVAEAMVAGGMVTALVAAGALKQPPVTQLTSDEVDARIARLEAAETRRAAERAREAAARIAPVKAERKQVAMTAAAKAKERVDAVRNERRTVLEARVAAARARVGAAPLHVVPFDEDKHPRDHEGKFRRVLARLESIFHGSGEAGHAAGDALQQVQDAAGKEEAGDREGAVASAREGARKLEAAAQQAGGEIKATLMDAAQAVRSAADDAHGAEEAAGTGDDEGAAEVIFDALAEPLKEQLLDAVARAEEQLDPANPEELFNKVKAFITGTNPLSLRDVQKFIKNQIKREVAPHGPDAGGGPSPTSPTVKGPQGPQIGNGPTPS